MTEARSAAVRVKAALALVILNLLTAEASMTAAAFGGREYALHDEMARRLTIPGLDPVTASAMALAFGPTVNSIRLATRATLSPTMDMLKLIWWAVIRRASNVIEDDVLQGIVFLRSPPFQSAA
jgi:hypothetical protein